jgi:general secretion pathway protein D
MGVGVKNDELTLAERLQRGRQFTPAERIYPNDTGASGKNTTVIRGTGNFINTDAARRLPPLEQVDGEVTLNFELADIRDVVKIVFDTLGENYVLDPRVQGEVTVQTSRPLPKEMLLPTLESLLAANGATLLRSGGVYKILPISEAVRGNSSPRLNSARLGPGYSVRIFPLKYISVTEMQTILQPFAPEGGILLADPVRNLLILAGTSQELEYLQETIEIFDVNWLKGMSVGMYVLQNVESQDMATELDKLFGAASELPLAGLFRFVPIERLNAILVITPQAEFLNDVSAWIERLDGSGGERLYVYEVQYSDSEYLASLIYLI